MGDRCRCRIVCAPVRCSCGQDTQPRSKCLKNSGGSDESARDFGRRSLRGRRKVDSPHQHLHQLLQLLQPTDTSSQRPHLMDDRHGIAVCTHHRHRFPLAVALGVRSPVVRNVAVVLAVRNVTGRCTPTRRSTPFWTSTRCVSEKAIRPPIGASTRPLMAPVSAHQAPSANVLPRK